MDFKQKYIDMNGFEIVQRVNDFVQFDEVLRTEISKISSPEQRNIDSKMISNGSGTMEGKTFNVPARFADKLNDIPNPERNGLNLLFSYYIFNILSGREQAIREFLYHFYQVGEVMYQGMEKGPVARGRKKDAPDGFVIRLEDIGLTESKPASLGSITPTEYERLRRFVSEGMLPAIEAFQRRWSVGVIYRSVNFRNLSLNLFKGVREIRVVNQTLQTGY
jgi:hypothetical protein